MPGVRTLRRTDIRRMADFAMEHNLPGTHRSADSVDPAETHGSEPRPMYMGAAIRVTLVMIFACMAIARLDRHPTA